LNAKHDSITVGKLLRSFSMMLSQQTISPKKQPIKFNQQAVPTSQ